MSTLRDLLAEHTVLPGEAVAHLPAVIREWQLLADLSFADHLMWVRRENGTVVCVTLVSAELDGSLAARAAPGGGTEMVLRMPIGSRRHRAG